MIFDMRLLTLYQEFLVKLANIEDRPYSLPKTLDSLKKNVNNFNMFIKLKSMLDKNNITQRGTIKKFMDCSETVLGSDFGIISINIYFDDIIKEFEIHDKRSSYDIDVITRGINYIQEYCLLHEIKDERDLYSGNPCLIMKMWKQKEIDDVLLISLIDIDSMKKKKWFKIYCRDLNNVKIQNIKKRLEEKPVKLTIEGGLKILKKVFNTTVDS